MRKSLLGRRNNIRQTYLGNYKLDFVGIDRDGVRVMTNEVKGMKRSKVMENLSVRLSI